MPEAKDEIEIQAKAEGVSVRASGQAASGIAESLSDVLSPFTNAFGMLGDQVRIARRVAVLKSAKRAKEKLAEEGIHEGNVPPKILLPWLEGASLETDEDETLQEAWAGLLVRAVKSADAANASYMEVLRKMGAEEAKLLNFFAGDSAPFYSSKFYGLNEVEPFSRENPLFHNIAKSIDKRKNHGEFRECFEGLGLQLMRQVIFFSVDGNRYDTTPFFDQHEVAISNLEHLGLVRVEKGDFETEEHMVSVVWFEITKFGFDMMYACNGTITGGEHKFFFRDSGN
ncbi:MAG: hypothetical protein Tsb0019_07440 [Roseibium sp.]